MGTHLSFKKARWFAGLMALAALSGSAQAEPLCIGSKNAKSYWVYFHGIDDVGVGKDEKQSRATLKALSQSLPLAFGIARSQKACANDKTKLCWDHSSNEAIKTQIESSVQQLTKCQNNRAISGYIGFSNGAYLVSKFAQLCLNKAARYIAVGGGGSLTIDKKLSVSKANCGKLTLMIGKKDMSFANIKRLYQLLKASDKYPVDFVPFKGGHKLPLMPLKNIISID
jgi:predicted esterase